jgi:Crp-like helix-turn-helix domain
VAILDDRVLPALRAWPAIGSRLIARAARQAARAAEQRAISQLPRVELRIRALLWHLAERWGRIGASGVLVPLELTHEALGRLVGARRPTVTLALSELARTGAVTRRADGSWVLRADSNPSSPPRLAPTRPGIAPVDGSDWRHEVGGESTLPRHPVGAALAERVEQMRVATAHEQARSAALLARCVTTTERAPGERLRSTPAR